MSSSELICVKQAIELDGRHQHFPALIKYTEALVAIGNSLLDSFRAENFSQQVTSAKRLLFILNQSVDRINALFKISEENVESGDSTAGNAAYQAKSRFNARDSETEKLENHPSWRATGDVPTTSSSTNDDPVASAVDQNRRLIAAHVEKMKSMSLTSSAVATVNMSLQRQLAENLELAKQQKRELEERKEKARQGALKSLTKRKDVERLSEDEKQFIVDVRVFEPDCSELHLLSGELNQYHKNRVNTVQFKTIFDHYVDTILNHPDHPWSIEKRRLRDSRQQYLNGMDTVTTGTIRTAINDDVNTLLNYLIHSLLFNEELKPAQSQLRERVEENYLNGLMPSLAEYFRRVRQQDVEVMKDKLDEKKSFNMYSPPPAIVIACAKTFRSFSDALTPRAMLKILVSTCKSVSCQDSQYEGKESLGADDLICALTAVIMESGRADIIVWSAIMEEFIDVMGDESVVGEEGFCLTSLLAAIQYVCSD